MVREGNIKKANAVRKLSIYYQPIPNRIIIPLANTDWNVIDDFFISNVVMSRLQDYSVNLYLPFYIDNYPILIYNDIRY